MRRSVVDPHGRQADPGHGQPAEGDGRWGQRGQVLVIFAGSLVALMMLMALVVDIGWYWSNGLRMQRAADAAALAGAVYMPDKFNGTAPNAQSAALDAARRNGYVPDANTTIVSTQDANPRQINVTITDKIGTFFLKVVGIQTLDASRSSKAEFVLPVPMGSPQNYYGVGTSMGTTPAVSTNHDTSGTGNSTLMAATTSSAGTWTVNTGTLATAVNASDTSYAATATNNATQQWGSFGLTSQLAANQTINSVDGIQVVLTDAYVSAACANSTIQAQLSWNNGGNWTTASGAPTTGALTTSTTTGDFTLGSTTTTSAWAGHSWIPADVTDAKFRVELTALKGCPNAGKELRLDQLQVIIYYHTDTVTTSPATPTVDNTPRVVPNPAGGSLTTQGFWGAVITKGGSRENGDQFAPANDNNSYAGHTSSNPDFDGKGVDYTVIIAGPNGQVQLFDPTFCATAASAGGGFYGAGDHWIGGSPNGVTTIFTLWDENKTPYDTTDDQWIADTSGLFTAQIQGDYSGNYGLFGTPPAGITDCSGDPYHNKWYVLKSGVPAGKYRLNVSTNVVGNSGTNAENMWSAWVSSSTGKSQVYGEGKMVTYNNLVAGPQLFYLAQIDKVHAGKTMEIKLFDPGDVSGNAFLKILSPDGNAYNYVSNFTYTADNGRSGIGPSIQTASSASGTFYQDALITITIPLPSTYGSVGLTPPSEALTGAGWWKIEYTVAGGNDTTTWQVDIQGNPVHLLVP